MGGSLHLCLRIHESSHLSHHEHEQHWLVAVTLGQFLLGSEVDKLGLCKAAQECTHGVFVYSMSSLRVQCRK